MHPKHTFCSRCGVRHPDKAWPRACASCGGTEWGNPTPVAVVLQPVGEGILIGRRNIEPGLGKFGLPGGFVDRHETFRFAAARELMEEMAMVVDEEDLTFFGEYIAEDSNILLTFWLAPAIALEDLRPFEPNSEVSERGIADLPIELAFVSHTLMLKRALERR